MTLEQINALKPGPEADKIIAREIMGTGATSFPVLAVITKEPGAPRYTTDFSLIWLVFEAVLLNAGSVQIYADIEDYGRGLITQGSPECAVEVHVAGFRAFEPMPMALCRAALASKFLPLPASVGSAIELSREEGQHG